MGVKATLLGVTLTAADIAQAEALGIDVKGMITTAGAKCDDLKADAGRSGQRRSDSGGRYDQCQHADQKTPLW